MAGRLIAVGDRYQCVDINTLIQTPEGNKSAGDLKPGDKVLSWRNNAVVTQTVKHVLPSDWTKGFEITTESGKKLYMSPNHRIWASDLYNVSDFLVYLMYRKDMGFRVGVTNKAGSKSNPYGSRTRSEKAEKLWILERYNDRESALLAEEWYSLKYAIPKCVFEGEGRGLNQNRIDLIFGEFGANGVQLLAEKHLSFDLPHWQACGITTDTINRNVVRMVAHGSKTTAVSFEWTGEMDFGNLDVNIKKARDSKSGRERFRIRKYFHNYREALDFAQKLSTQTKARLVRKLHTPEGALRLLTASALFTGMKVAVLDNDSIRLEEIVSIEEKEGGTFIDLDVDDASNFFGNGILSHNCIYAFAGADVNALQELIETLNAPVLPLTCSFRCAKNIIAEAQQYNPNIEAAPDAIDGVVDDMSIKDLLERAEIGSAIISRTNAPLVKLFFKMAKVGKRVCMLGRDYGAMLTMRIKSWKKKHGRGFTGLALLERNDQWLNEQMEYLQSKNLSTDRVQDEHATIQVLAEDLDSSLGSEESVAEILDRIGNMFTEENDNKHGQCVTLSSTHKFKGLERDHIYMLVDTYKAGDENQEETNLAYVAVTRAKKHLTYVCGTTKGL